MDRGLLANATSADDSPTPGYMLNEIARATTANYQTNTQLQEFLISRLTKNNHNVKYKCLVIIKHVCRNGRAEFKREMGRNVAPIKECLQYRGPPDPLRGDEIYKRVRDAAKDALDAIFDSQMPVTTSAVAAANRIQGMGNDYVPEETNKGTSSTERILSNVMSSIQNTVMGDGTDIKYEGHRGAQSNFVGSASGGASGFGGSHGSSSSSGGVGSYSSSSGMSGLGNPNYSDPRLEKTWLQKAKDVAVDVASNASAKIQTLRGDSGSMTRTTSGNGSFQNPSFNHSSGTFAGATAGNSNGFNYATNRGNNAYNSSLPGYGMSNAQAPRTSGGVVPDMPEIGPPGSGRAGGASDDGSYERSFIDSLCEPSGLKPVPAEDKLLDFLKAAPTLNEDIVGNCLIDVLNRDEWQSRVKALIVIAKLAALTEDTAHLEFWQEENHISYLRECTSDAKAGVRTQATKTLRVVDPNGFNGTDAGLTTSSASSKATASTKSAVQREASLLDTDDLLDTMSSAATSTTPMNAIVPSGSVNAELAALSNKTSAASADNALDAGLFEGLSISPTPSSNPSPPPPPSFMSATTTAGAVVAQANFNPAAADDLSMPDVARQKIDVMSHFDLLDDPLSNGSQAQGVHSAPPTLGGNRSGSSFSQPSGDLFSDMVVVNNNNNTAAANVAKAPPASYADDLASLTMPSGFNSAMMSSGPSSTGLSGGGPMMPMMQRPVPSMGYPPGPMPSMPQQPGQMYYGAANGLPAGLPQAPPQFVPGRGPVPSTGGIAQQYCLQQQQQQQQVARPQPGMQVRPQSSVLAPGMLSLSAERKTIPTANDIGNSGFTFIGGGGGTAAANAKNTNADDSFSFISAAMNAEQQRKK